MSQRVLNYKTFRLYWIKLTCEIPAPEDLFWVACYCEAVSMADYGTKDIADMLQRGVKPMDNVEALELWLEEKLDSHNGCVQCTMDWIAGTMFN